MTSHGSAAVDATATIFVSVIDIVSCSNTVRQTISEQPWNKEQGTRTVQEHFDCCRSRKIFDTTGTLAALINKTGTVQEQHDYLLSVDQDKNYGCGSHE